VSRQLTLVGVYDDALKARNAYERLRASRNEAARSPMPDQPRGPSMADMQELNDMPRSNPAAGSHEQAAGTSRHHE
jgi:hypothetical protein